MRAVVALACDHLGCCVAGAATGCLERLTRFVRVAESKIDDFDVHVVVEEQVLWFEIAMHDIEFVQVLYA